MRLSHQLALILFASVMFGAINNLRTRAHIPWVQKWASIEEIKANGTKEEPDESAENKINDLLSTEEVEMLLIENVGQSPSEIDLTTALSIFEKGKDLTVWIDARTEDLYEEGHIPGAVLLDFYDQQPYLNDIEALIEDRQPISLILYCKGKDCHDSHLLAESLSFHGHGNIFVYTGGWSEWHEDFDLPIEGPAIQSKGLIETEKTKPLPQGMYLEHILRDLIPFSVGLLILVFWKKTLNHRLGLGAIAILCGSFFIWAAVPKIASPFTFAKNIWNYNLVPDIFINSMGLTLPWIEILTGIGIVIGLNFRKLRPHLLRGSSLIISVLLVIFIIAISTNVIRNHEFECGCTSNFIYFRDLYFAGWNDKITLLLRDFGLLSMSLACFFASPGLEKRAILIQEK